VPRAVFVRYAYEGTIPLDEVEADPYELPPEGSKYWQHDAPWIVSRVQADTDPPKIHMVLDRDRLTEFLDGLPAGARIDAGRRGDDGTWHAHIESADGLILGSGFADAAADPDVAVATARSEALKRIG